MSSPGTGPPLASRRAVASMLLAWIGAAACVATASMRHASLGIWFYVLLGAAALIVWSSLLVRRPLSAETDDPEGQLEVVREELNEAARQLQRRQRELDERLTTFHEWMEFPAPLQLKDPPPPEDDREQLAEKDRLLLELLSEETETLLNRILENKYTVDGRLSLDLVREDVKSLVLRVARLYHKEVDEPLLETSMALVLRSVSRAALQLLVVMEQLPLDVKDMSISKLYGYIRTAVQAYGVYKSAGSYLPWVSNAYLLGRFALGVNPLTLGAWYATGTLGKQAAKSAATRLVNRHALQLVHSMVRLIGFEVAQVYGGDFRRRDPNWIYAAELTDLVAQLPASARTLSLALGEIGALQLRSEYDRVWFYRCLAAGKPAGADDDSARIMEPRERSAVAQRLEHFVGRLPGAAAQTLEQWRTGAEQRLGVQLGADASQGADATSESLRSLAGFLLEIKELEPDQLLPTLGACKSAASADDQLAALASDPPFLFEYPLLAPGSDAAATCLQDLVTLAAKLPRRGEGVVLLLEEVGAYLRVDIEHVRSMWSAALLSELQGRLADRLRGSPPGPLAALVLEMLDRQDPSIRCVLYPARLENVENEAGDKEAGTPLVLLAVNDRLAAWGSDEEEPAWEAPIAEVRAQRQRGVVSSSCLLHAAHDDRVLLVEGASWTRYQRHFGPLLEVLGVRQKNESSE